MAPIPVWSGNLRLSLVLVPVRLYPATSTEGAIAFRMIHEPSGKPIKYVKGVETERGFEEVPEEEIIKLREGLTVFPFVQIIGMATGRPFDHFLILSSFGTTMIATLWS